MLPSKLFHTRRLVHALAIMACIASTVFAQETPTQNRSGTQPTVGAQDGSAPPRTGRGGGRRRGGGAQAQPAGGEQQAQQPQQRIDAITQTVTGQTTNTSAGEPSGTTVTDQTVKLDARWLRGIPWRPIGPANMGGRIVDFAVYEPDPTMYWVATAGGGVLKTTNNGITFDHQFTHEGTISIGSIAVAQSDPNIVWVGTGENNPRNSVSFGDGVYKSVDGGKTWKHMGLRKSFQIGRVVINKTNANMVYVGALGRLYGPNEERGLYQTSDGGETWERSLYIDDKTGVVDVQMHPTDSKILLAATWERRRDEYDSHPGGTPMEDGYDSYDPIKKWGPGAGIFKTTDGGKNWRKLTNGLPTSNMGRIGLDFYRKDPKTIFAIIDCEKIGMGETPRIVDVDITGENVEGGVRLTDLTRTNGASAKAGLKADDIVKALDEKAITTIQTLLEDIRAHKVGDRLKFKIQRGDRTEDILVTLEERPEAPAGGGAFLGVATGDGTEDGVKVTELTENSPAARAGLKADDVVQSVGETSVQSINQINQAIAGRNAGERVKLKISRDGQVQEIDVTLAERPAGLAVAGARRGAGGGGGGGGARGGSRTRPSGANLGGQMENVQDQQGPNGFQFGGIYKSTDGGESWTRINSYNPRPMYFSLLKVDPNDDRHLYVGGVNLSRSTNYGRTFRGDAGRGVHADHHALWINPRDGRHMMIGSDGGFYVSYDRSANWDHINTADIAQFYHVAISPKYPYYVAGGLQDNGSWFGPSMSLSGGGPINEDWINIGGGDGFVCRVDPNDPDIVYSESQNGSISRRDLRTGVSVAIRPVARGGGGGGRGNRGTGGRGDAGGTTNTVAEGGGAGGGGGGARGGGYRHNWNTPFILSSANSRIFYSAGNYVFRSLNRGDNLQPISPEITLTAHGSATALAESPRNPDVLYVGTDDGALWITRDGGRNWSNITANVGLPKPSWVATIEPSRFVEGRAYVAFDLHRMDSDDPCVYVTEDFGRTWTSIRNNLPWGSSRVLREDIVNPNLLLLGTEFGAWFSLDRGKFWNKFGTNFPTVAVHEFAFHPANGEVVAATHGRSLWVLDASALRQIRPEYLTESPMLYKPSDAIRWRGEGRRGGTNRKFVGTNPTPGAQIYYSLPRRAETVTIRVYDVAGNTLMNSQGNREPGLYRVTWGFAGGGGGRRGGGGGGAAAAPGQRAERGGGQGAAVAQRGGAGAGVAQRGGGGGGGAAQRGGRGGIEPGSYKVVLSVDNQEFVQTVRVESDPMLPNALTGEELRAQEAGESGEGERREGQMEEKDEPATGIVDRDGADGN